MGALAVGFLNLIDAVTIDANGTLVAMIDPIPKLREALRERDIEREPEAIARAFAAEGAHYQRRSFEGHDEESVARLNADCAGFFLRELAVELEPEEFAEAYVDTFEFELVAGARETVEVLRRRGLELAIVADWDVSLHETLAGLALDGFFSAVVTSADAGACKPDPAPFLLALERLGVPPQRALHVGDAPRDEEGARAAGMRFAPAPLATLLERV
jgi:putative hydrolase of the HAD superfamily